MGTMSLDVEQALKLKAQVEEVSRSIGAGKGDIKGLSEAQDYAKWGTQVESLKFRKGYISELFELELALGQLESEIATFAADYQRAVKMLQDTEDDVRAASEARGRSLAGAGIGPVKAGLLGGLSGSGPQAESVTSSSPHVPRATAW